GQREVIRTKDMSRSNYGAAAGVAAVGVPGGNRGNIHAVEDAAGAAGERAGFDFGIKQLRCVARGLAEDGQICIGQQLRPETAGGPTGAESGKRAGGNIDDYLRGVTEIEGNAAGSPERGQTRLVLAGDNGVGWRDGGDDVGRAGNRSQLLRGNLFPVFPI